MVGREERETGGIVQVGNAAEAAPTHAHEDGSAEEEERVAPCPGEDFIARPNDKLRPFCWGDPCIRSRSTHRDVPGRLLRKTTKAAIQPWAEDALVARWRRLATQPMPRARVRVCARRATAGDLSGRTVQVLRVGAAGCAVREPCERPRATSVCAACVTSTGAVRESGGRTARGETHGPSWRQNALAQFAVSL